MAVVFALSYLLYPPLQKAVNFDFHAVTLSTPLLLGMYYFWLKKMYIRSSLFLFLTLLTKEQVGLVIALFGMYVLIKKVTDMDFSFLKAKIRFIRSESLSKQRIVGKSYSVHSR
ncbi:DUF2079 domain-containing protein [Candidatus Roizmanbacteria bacterium]|nr:MAG: DUF2079 domain-containing protein [Candidatus Roizmanbacteria bacterium]